MFEISDPYFVSVVLFFALLGIVIYRDRKNMEFHSVVIMRRTKRFRDIIEWIANLSPRFWKFAATLGILMAVGVMFYGFFLLLATASSIVRGLITQPALQLILPTPSASGASGPGYMLIPFWFWIVTIGAILVPHETMHGIIARAEKIKLKSVGLLLMIIFPGAFVEPDERQLQKSSLLTRLRIFAGGSFANFSMALITVGVLAFIVWPLVAGNGIILDTVTEGSPAALAGFIPGQLLTEANGHSITTTYWEFAGGKGYLADELGTVKAGDKLTFVADGSEKTVEVATNPETNAPYIGITYKPIMKVPLSPFFTVVNLLSMIWVFSFAVGMVNILPIYPLDGGLMFEAVMKKYLKEKRARFAVRVMTYTLILVLLFDFVGPWLMSLF